MCVSILTNHIDSAIYRFGGRPDLSLVDASPPLKHRQAYCLSHFFRRDPTWFRIRVWIELLMDLGSPQETPRSLPRPAKKVPNPSQTALRPTRGCPRPSQEVPRALQGAARAPPETPRRTQNVFKGDQEDPMMAPRARQGRLKTP